jgi:oligopeptide transport system substrate-binding protein
MATYPARLEVINRWGDSWTEPQHIVTLGPYRLKSWRHEYKIELTANPQYYNGHPAVANITMYMVQEMNTALDLYESNTLDYVSIPEFAIPRYELRSDYRRLPYLSGYYYGFNTTKAPFDRPKVRLAFSMAIDRSVLPTILHGSVAASTSWIPPGLLGHNPNIGVKFDPDRARQLLKEAGYNSTSHLPPITFAYNTNDTHKLVAENVKKQWKSNLGVDVRLDNMEWKVYLQQLKTDPPQIFRLGWNADYPDPDNFMGLFTGNSGNNHTHWASAEYDRLVGLAAAEPDPDKRAEYYYSAQRLLTEKDCAIAPLFFSSLNRLISPRVEGLNLNIMDILFLKQIRIKHF